MAPAKPKQDVQCPACGGIIRTSIRGANAKCTRANDAGDKCGTTVYIRKDGTYGDQVPDVDGQADEGTATGDNGEHDDGSEQSPPPAPTTEVPRFGYASSNQQTPPAAGKRPRTSRGSSADVPPPDTTDRRPAGPSSGAGHAADRGTDDGPDADKPSRRRRLVDALRRKRVPGVGHPYAHLWGQPHE